VIVLLGFSFVSIIVYARSPWQNQSCSTGCDYDFAEECFVEIPAGDCAFGVFLAAGIVLGALLRLGVREVVGERISLPDRLAGALLGAVRIGLVAVLIVLIFDRVIPTDREPAFLKGSRLRPLLSQAGEAGVNSLPPEAVQAIDRLKHARGI
jgi:uncharacterized membrane protein required for colicin V production